MFKFLGFGRDRQSPPPEIVEPPKQQPEPEAPKRTPEELRAAMKERARSQRNQELKRQMESEPEPEAITDVQFETRPSGPAGKGPMIFFETRTEATTALLNAVAKDVLEGQSNYVFHQVGTGNTPGRHGWELGNSVKDQLPELVDEIKRQAEGILELAA